MYCFYFILIKNENIYFNKNSTNEYVNKGNHSKIF